MCLGQGSFGTVFRARRDGNVYALKVSNSQEQSAELNGKRFELEANILQSINSNRIPKFIEAFSLDSKHVIVQEMIEGDPLSYYIYNGHHFTEDDVKNIICQLLNILNELHNPIRMENAIVHRDLRLSNLLIKNGELYLIDFGFARYLQSSKSGVLPDPAFSNQEGLDRALKVKTLRKPGAYTYRLLRREISPRSDLFGTGVVAIDLFTNWVKDEELFNQPWEHVLPLSDQFTRFLQKLLSRDRQGFSNCGEALMELGNIR